MTVNVIAQFEDMVEQLMIAKGIDNAEEIVEQAIGAMYAQLPDEAKAAALDRMVEDGLNSGVYEGDPFAEIMGELNDQVNLRKTGHAA